MSILRPDPTLIEKIRRKPINQKLIETTHIVFIVLLLTFMAFVTFNDITNLFRSF